MIRLIALGLLVANLLFLGWTAFVGSSEPRLVAVPVAARTTPLPPPPKPPCTTVGPFADEAALRKVQHPLQAAGWGALQREETTQVADGFWVTVEELGSSAAQARVLTALRRAGINDAFAMPDDRAFRVSVGIFTDRARADDRAARVQSLDLAARVNDRLRDVRTQWLDVPGVPPAALGDGRLATAGVELGGVRLLPCP